MDTFATFCWTGLHYFNGQVSSFNCLFFILLSFIINHISGDSVKTLFCRLTFLDIVHDFLSEYDKSPLCVNGEWGICLRFICSKEGHPSFGIISLLFVKTFSQTWQVWWKFGKFGNCIKNLSQR